MKRNILRIAIAGAVLVMVSTSCKFISYKGSEAVRNLGELMELTPADESGINMGERVYNDIPSIRYIICEGSYDIEYTQGPERVVVSAPDKYIHQILVKTSENGELVLTGEGKVAKNIKNVKVRISSPQLTGIDVNGAIVLNADAISSPDDFKFNIYGAADADIKSLSAANLSLCVNGAGDIEISGIKCSRTDITINGAGDVTLKGEAGSAEATINGVGSINAKDLSCPDFKTHRNGIGSISR